MQSSLPPARYFFFKRGFDVEMRGSERRAERGGETHLSGQRHRFERLILRIIEYFAVFVFKNIDGMRNARYFIDMLPGIFTRQLKPSLS